MLEWPIGSAAAAVCSPARRQSGQTGFGRSSVQLRAWLPMLGGLAEGCTTASVGWICHVVCCSGSVWWCAGPCTVWRLGVWQGCAGPSPTFRGAVTTALWHVDFCTHLDVACQHMEDSAWNFLPQHLWASDLSLNSFRHPLRTFMFTQMTPAVRRVPGTLCHPASLRLRHSAPSSVV